VASSESNPTSNSINQTINQSGLSAGFTSGVTNFDAYLAGNPLHTAGGGTSWFTPLNVTSATIVYDLGDVYAIDRLALWNEEFSGIGSLDISTSLDNITFGTVASGLIPVDPPVSSSKPAEVFSFGLHTARYIQFDVGNCPQSNGGNPLTNNRCSIDEVAFSAVVPIPAAIWLFGSGLLGLIGVARHKKYNQIQN
jgi:hypothetical protein